MEESRKHPWDGMSEEEIAAEAGVPVEFMRAKVKDNKELAEKYVAAWLEAAKRAAMVN